MFRSEFGQKLELDIAGRNSIRVGSQVTNRANNMTRLRIRVGISVCRADSDVTGCPQSFTNFSPRLERSDRD